MQILQSGQNVSQHSKFWNRFGFGFLSHDRGFSLNILNSIFILHDQRQHVLIWISVVYNKQTNNLFCCPPQWFYLGLIHQNPSSDIIHVYFSLGSLPIFWVKVGNLQVATNLKWFSLDRIQLKPESIIDFSSEILF